MDRHVFLIGMMGCGKSTIGRLLSRRLGCPLLDLDEEIARFEGRTIPEIFANSGDAGFRVCEHAALARACAGAPCVVATGGGITGYVIRGILLGTVLAAGLLVLIFLLDNRPKSPEDIAQSADIPTLAVLPACPELSGDKKHKRKARRA